LYINLLILDGNFSFCYTIPTAAFCAPLFHRFFSPSRMKDFFVNYMMIFTSIFLFGVSAGLFLAYIIRTHDGSENKRLKNWKSNF